MAIYGMANFVSKENCVCGCDGIYAKYPWTKKFKHPAPLFSAREIAIAFKHRGSLNYPLRNMCGNTVLLHCDYRWRPPE